MNRLRRYLERNRLAELVDKIDAGQAIADDLAKLAAVQPFEAAAAGRAAVVDAIDREDQANADFERTLAGLAGD